MREKKRIFKVNSGLDEYNVYRFIKVPIQYYFCDSV